MVINCTFIMLRYHKAKYIHIHFKVRQFLCSFKAKITIPVKLQIRNTPKARFYGHRFSGKPQFSGQYCYDGTFLFCYRLFVCQDENENEREDESFRSFWIMPVTNEPGCYY